MVSVFLLCLTQISFSQSESDMVKIPINDYMIGTSYNYTKQIIKAFSDDAVLYLTGADGPMTLSPSEYADLFIKREEGKFNGRQAKILSIKTYQDIAIAEVEIIIHSINARFIDVMILKKLEDEWKIVSKTATRYPLKKNGSIAKRELVVEGLKHPWSMDFISPTVALVAEKDGDLLKLDLATGRSEVISGFPDDLFETFTLDNSKYPKGTYPARSDGKEIRWNAGILEVLLDPDFSENKFVYISYVAQKKDLFALKVIRAKLEDLQLTDIVTLLNPGPYVPGLFHFGGGMTFGTDGKLYITVKISPINGVRYIVLILMEVFLLTIQVLVKVQ